jgi:dihydroorotase-like cyclic amidohydrolase
METFSLFSNFITIPGTTHPISGVISISGEIISDIQILSLSDHITYETIKNHYQNLHDFSNYYISPGLIDLNVRIEYESLESYSKSAISGGVTFSLLEESLYSNQTLHFDHLYSDIGLLKTIDDSIELSSFDDYFAIKTYLFKPSALGKSLQDLQHLKTLNLSQKKCIFIDPTLPETRLMMLNSPNRLKDCWEHVTDAVQSRLNIWADAFEAGSDSESSSSELPLPKRTVSLFEVVPDIIGEDLLITPNLHSKGGDEIITHSDPSDSPPCKQHHSNYHFHVHSSTLFDELDKKVTENASRRRSVINAEEKSYRFNGESLFSSFASTEPGSPLKAVKPQLKVLTSFSDSEKFADYTAYLANCPENWEVRGISKVLSCGFKEISVHFQGISSATAINLVRRAFESFRFISCELPASHLYFSSDSVKPKDTRFKCHPPIRDSSNFELTWDLVKLRSVQVISSNHSKISSELKAGETGNFLNALPGINCSGFSLQAVWTSQFSRFSTRALLTLPRLFKWMSLQPSQILHLEKRGRIQRGAFADLIIWDPFSKDDREKSNIFEGHILFGKVEIVYLRGKVAFNKGLFHACGSKRSPSDELP